MSNEWHEKEELPPFNLRVELYYNGYAQGHAKLVDCTDGNCCWWNFDRNEYQFGAEEEYSARPIQSDRDKLVEQAIKIAGEAGAECDATFAGALIDAGWRPVKPMTEEYFVGATSGYYDEEASRNLYRAGCRFIEQGE